MLMKCVKICCHLLCKLSLFWGYADEQINSVLFVFVCFVGVFFFFGLFYVSFTWLSDRVCQSVSTFLVMVVYLLVIFTVLLVFVVVDDAFLSFRQWKRGHLSLDRRCET